MIKSINVSRADRCLAYQITGVLDGNWPLDLLEVFLWVLELLFFGGLP